MHRTKHTGSGAIVITILVLVMIVLYSGLQILETTVLSTDTVPESVTPSKTVVKNGKSYFPRQDITVILVMGIDQFGPVTPSNSYNNKGAADVVFLLILDETEESFRILYLNRDTMLTMPVLGLGGRYAGDTYAQLALSHTYGSGLEDSCENTQETVSEFLNDLYIDYYLAMNMDAISILNDSVGGVSITVTEDFSLIDPSIPLGVTTLKSDQALNYIRSRKDLGDQLNLSRISRQMEYMNGFLDSFRKAMTENEGFTLELADKLSKYIVTNCPANTLSAMMERCGNFSLKEIVTPEGENVLGDQYYEFHVNEEKLDALILRLFYKEKN